MTDYVLAPSTLGDDADDASASSTLDRTHEGDIPRMHVTDSRLPLLASYGPTDGDAEQPGEYPFTRGLNSTGYRDELWHRDIYAGFGNVEEAKARYESLLRGGASGVNIALDLPTQLGYDSDHPDALSEAGKVGVAIDSVQDVYDLFRDIALTEAGIVFTVANGIGPMALAWFVLLGERQGLSPSDYVIHLQNDPMKEFTGRGAFVFPIESSIRLACDVVEYAARHRYLHWKPIGICGSQFRWGGGTAVHEIALGIASARTYIDELIRRGLAIDDFAPLLEMHLVADLDVFEEAAKFRAARRVWARMLRDEYGATLPESQHLRVSLYTGGYRLTAQEPLNNAVRITLQALGAVLGGIQHLGTLSIDEALATPTAEAARLAVQTQNVLAYETSIASVADPLGGSYLVEHLTSELEARIQDMMARIQREGGFIRAVKDGLLQSMIDDASYTYQKEIEDGIRTVVGVNRFTQHESAATSVKTFKLDPASNARQLERLGEHRRRRDGASVTRSLDNLRVSAAGSMNLVEPIIEAFRVGATIGEVCDNLRAVLGSWQDEHVLL
jgi:methylmalonyl-CoA mutase N-terminal domain/subunit